MWHPSEKIFNLDEVDKALSEEPVTIGDDGFEEIKQYIIYLGTVYNQTPSGKYYTPFACSNVDPCPRCDGKGDIPNKRHKKKDFDRLVKQCNRIVKHDIIDKNTCYADMAVGPRQKLDSLREKMEYYRPMVECPLCHGLGSYEAFLDQAWFDQAEEELQEIDAYLECDGDDLFICRLGGDT